MKQLYAISAAIIKAIVGGAALGSAVTLLGRKQVCEILIADGVIKVADAKGCRNAAAN